VSGGAGLDGSVNGRVREPIIIIGAPRSGTTLLAGLLDAHPLAATMGEPRLVWRYGNDRWSDQLRVRNANPQSIDHIHNSFATFLRERGAERLVEKTPANAVRPRFVDHVFPDARYVHITRNGWGAVPSMRAFWDLRGTGMDAKQVGKLKRRMREAHPSQLRFYARELVRRASARTGRHVPLYGPRLAGLQQIADELGRLEASALQWRTAIDETTTFGRALPTSRYFEVKLECLDAATLDQIVDFCGLPPSDAVTERFREVHRREAAAGRLPLAADERELIAAYVVPTNSWLGYADEWLPGGSLTDGAPR